MRKEYTRKRKEAQEEVKRLLFKISSYCSFLESCLKQEKSLPVLSRHIDTQRNIKSNPFTQKIVATVSIPPHIQAILMEELFLLEERTELVKQKKHSKNELHALNSRLKVIQTVLARWYELVELGSPPNIFAKYKNITPHIGDNWELLFVENLVLQLPSKNFPKPK